MLRRTLLAMSRSAAARRLVENAPVSRDVVARFVAGRDTADAVRVARDLIGQGLAVTVDHLGEDTADRAQAAVAAQAYLSLLDALAAAGLTSAAEVSVKLSAVGQALPGDGEQVALEGTRRICARARELGTTVTLDMEDHTTTDSTLGILHDLRADFPETGVAVQAYLRRTEADCRDLAGAGARVRLCKGAYAEPASVAFQDRAEVDLSFVRCARVLLSGQGYPMLATHDPRLIEIAGAMAARYRRERGSYEYQMLYGVRPGEQRRLAALGETVRVYLPYGQEWYAYLVRRLAERPANVAFFIRALARRG